MKLFLSLVIALIALPLAYGQLSDRTGLGNDFIIETGGYEYEVEIVGNFDVNDVEFSAEEKKLTLYLNSQLENNLGEVYIPKNLTSGNFTFFLNDQEIFPDVKKNDRIAFITLKFNGTGLHKLDIIGTTYLPEFSHIASLVLASGLIGFIFINKKRIQKLFIN